MKMVTAIIRPEMFNAVRTALEGEGIYGMTVSEVMGRGAQKGIALQFRGKAVPVDLIPKLKIEMVVKDADVERIIRIVRAHARTGRPGDGRIFVLPIERICRVRTDEEDPPES
ncbi:P-II family nitrogen regulator [Methanoculleus sp.]|jgi:nitrogen regulatory protein P-II 1|uniref:P-II family nitrogen regulator n=1 Tax=Methanoculleus sp. TaxID=90427 RepID=UPI0026395065|nr:P-II family nitrogen regulator [Methanoculleus sp.]MDI6866101.1 P-II family nitrogen regulator [Methanoculleus sp.]